MYKQKYLKYKSKYINIKMQQGGSNKKRIYIVRHGETEWNVEKKQQGCEADIELNDTGKKQASITGKYLNDYQQIKAKIDIIYCSPQKRALKTAELIAKEIGYTDKIIIIDDLKENCIGKLSGTTEQEKKTNPVFDKLFELRLEYQNIVDPIEKMKTLIVNEEQISKIYGRETLKEIFIRIKKVLDQITTDNNKKILVVTHAGLMNTMFMHIGNTFDYKDGDVSNGQNCKIGYIEYENGKFQIITNPNTLHFNL